MATILEETIRLGVPADLAIAALSMPSRAAATGAMRYTIPGEGGSEFIRAKTPEEVAAAARQLGGVAAANANPYAGRVFGNTIGQAQGASLNRRQQDIASMQFQQQMAAANDRARLAAQADAAERAMKLRLGQQEIDARRENSMQDFVARMAGVDARNYGTDVRYGGAVAGMPAAFSGGAAPARTVRSSANRVDPFATTVADNLYDRLESLQMEQQSAEIPFMRELAEAAGSVSSATGFMPDYEDGIPGFSDPAAQKAFLTRSDMSSPWGEEGPSRSIAESLAMLAADRGVYGGLAKLSQTNIDRAKASGRLGLPVPAARGTPLSPLAALLLRQPGTAGPGGTIQYSPEQVSAARSALGWRGAYGGAGVSAFGTTPLEQARAEEARRQATMRDPASWAPSRGPAVPPSASPAPTPTLASGDYRLVPRSSGIEAAAVNPLGASALGLSSILSTMLGGRRPVDAGTQAEIEQRRLAGEFPSTTAYIERYPQWLRSLLAAPGEITPPSSAAPAPLVPSGGRTTSWPGPAYVEPTVNPGILDLLAGRTPETATMSPAQRVAAMLGIAF